MSSNKEIIGRVERVRFPDLLPKDHNGVLAKIDTGADSGALHCAYIKLSKVQLFSKTQYIFQLESAISFRTMKGFYTKIHLVHLPVSLTIQEDFHFFLCSKNMIPILQYLFSLLSRQDWNVEIVLNLCF